MAFSLPNPFLTLYTILKLNHGYTFAVVRLVSRYLSVKLPLEYRRFFEKEREREREKRKVTLNSGLGRLLTIRLELHS